MMNFENINDWFSVILSGVQVGLNPCALVTLWGFFLYLSSQAKNTGMLQSGGWVFWTVTLLTNLLLTFGVFDFLLKQTWCDFLFLGAYAVIAVILVIQGLLHAYDWLQYRFHHADPSGFKIKLPVFFNHPQDVSWTGRMLFLWKGAAAAFVLNLLGSLWGHDYAVFMHVSHIYSTLGFAGAGIHLAGFYAGYMLPPVILWQGTLRGAKFSGQEHWSSPQVGFTKIFHMALSSALGMILGLLLIKVFF